MEVSCGLKYMVRKMATPRNLEETSMATPMRRQNV